MSPFELLLFTADPTIAAEALRSGVDAIVVDLECRDKDARQAGADTEVNDFSPADIAACREVVDGRIVVRINAAGEWTSSEVEDVLAAGADEILVPMVRTPADIDVVMQAVGGRVPVGALIETPEAVLCASAIAAMELSRIYIGLNDLAIARHAPNIFTSVADGLVEKVARAVVSAGKSLGFAGLTLPDRGTPVPCRLLMAEMSRLGCRHAFMRRSFLRDVEPGMFAEGVSAIRSALAEMDERNHTQVLRDRRLLVEAIEAWRAPEERMNA